MLAGNLSEKSNLVRNLSVLFVDDDADIRESMARYLSRRVGEVHTAQNGMDGLDSFKELRPDLVISDIRMGGMDGLTMCREIRKAEPELPVIIISAHNESDILLSSIDLGITKFIVKPVDTDALMQAISSVATSLEQKRNADSAKGGGSEAAYDTERVRSYVSRYLESNHQKDVSDIRHLNIPKLAVSGDFYVVARRGDDLYVMLADGAGHGLSAVLPALHLPRVFTQQAELGYSLRTIAAEINRSLYEQHFTEHFVAATLLRLNPQERFIEVMNCGNPPVFIFDEHNRPLYTCHSRSTPLGMVANDTFSPETERFEMDRNARIYLFTDGMFDTMQARFPNCGYAEFPSLFEQDCTDTPFEKLSEKVCDAAAHCQTDDITLLEVSFACASGPAVAETPVHEAAPAPAAETQVALNRKSILYVEDDDQTRENLAHFLGRRMAAVHLARNGLEGLELFKKRRPDIVLADIKMPQMSGLEMAREIRKIDKDVPIIVTSGSDHAEDAEQMFDMGVSRFHIKPLDPGKLVTAIQSCLRQVESQQQLHLSASAFQASSLAVITADAGKRIVTVNPAFINITGYSQEEMLGQSPTLLIANNRDTDHFKSMWQTLDETGSWSGELLCQHKNGSATAEWLTVNTVKGANGQISGYHFIFSDISERKMNEAKVQQLMSYDSLTHLPNRGMFEKRVNELLREAAQRNNNLALLNIKLSRFIEINNAYGVHAGDQVLSALSQILRDSTDGEDMAFRTGGVDFTVLLLEDGGREAIEQAVIRLASALNQPVKVDSHELHLRTSIGIGIYPADGTTYEELFKSAGSALDQAIRTGGNTYCFFDRLISEREERQTVLQQGIRSGLQRNEFFMMYQPKYSLDQKQVVGAEALIRWQHPAFGLISPVEFIPLAENSGTVIEMSEWVIDNVCAQIAAWREQGLKQVPVSINISPLHFWRGDLIGSLQNALQKWGLTPEAIPIEVTESVMMDASAKTLQVLGQLKSLGFHLSVDDFGTGYSSLKYLKDMPISELKIDRSFITEIPEDWRTNNLSKTAIPRSIIRLANEFGLGVVAEGVETDNQKDFLMENGCDVIQGYWFSRPMTQQDFATLLS